MQTTPNFEVDWDGAIDRIENTNLREFIKFVGRECDKDPSLNDKRFRISWLILLGSFLLD